MHLYCLYTQKSQITLFFASVIIFCVSTLFFLCHCSSRRQGRTRVATTDAVGTTVVTAPPDALKGAMTTTLVAFVKPQHAFFVCFVALISNHQHPHTHPNPFFIQAGVHKLGLRRKQEADHPAMNPAPGPPPDPSDKEGKKKSSVVSSEGFDVHVVVRCTTEIFCVGSLFT